MEKEGGEGNQIAEKEEEGWTLLSPSEKFFNAPTSMRPGEFYIQSHNLQLWPGLPGLSRRRDHQKVLDKHVQTISPCPGILSFPSSTKELSWSPLSFSLDTTSCRSPTSLTLDFWECSARTSSGTRMNAARKMEACPFLGQTTPCNQIQKCWPSVVGSGWKWNMQNGRRGWPPWPTCWPSSLASTCPRSCRPGGAPSARSPTSRASFWPSQDLCLIEIQTSHFPRLRGKQKLTSRVIFPEQRWR